MFNAFQKLKSVRILVVVVLIIGVFGALPVQAHPSVVIGWAKGMGGAVGQYGDSGTSLALDANGNIYTTGYFYGTVDFDPGAGIYNLVSAGEQDIFISKLDVDGNFEWAKRIGGSTDQNGRMIVLDGNGNIYLAGILNGGSMDADPGEAVYNLSSAGGFDIFIIKLDTNGDFVWAKRIGGTNLDVIYGLAVDESENVYMTGYFMGTVDFDPDLITSFPLTSAGLSDIFVSKLDIQGNFVWAKRIGDTGHQSGNSINVDHNGNVYITGDFSGTVDFDPGISTNNLESLGFSDIFISKLDTNGSFVWAKQMGGTGADSADSVALDENGNVYSTGYYETTADFDPDPGTSYNLTGPLGINIFMSKLDANGNFIWAKSMGGTDLEHSYDLKLDQSNNVYITGYFTDTMDFDPGAGITNMTSAGAADIFISKLDPNGSFVWAKQMGGQGDQVGNSLAVDGNGNVFFTGYFSQTADFDPGPGELNLTSAGGVDIFISKLNAIPQIHYVKWDADGAGNGSSWEDAYIDLQSALAAATTGDEIWVAAGTYKPTTGTDRSISFVLKNGVAIYGGFAGTETLRSERNPVTNVTILSGDLGEAGNASDNSYHVITSNNLDNTAVFDGFTITAGNANGASSYSGGGMYNEGNSTPQLRGVIFRANLAVIGAGMFNNLSNPVLTNVIFDGNTSSGSGGGMFNYQSSPTLMNVIFNANNGAATSRGGAMVNDTNSSPHLTNVTFAGNRVTYTGGAMLNTDNSNPILENVTFYDNTSMDRGGAIFNWASSPVLRNVTFSGNSAAVGGAIYNDNNSNPSIVNGILYGDLGGEIYNSSGVAMVTYSIIKGGYPGIGNIDADPLLGPLQDNGGFTPTMALRAGSPAINTGDDANCPENDQRGVTRPQGTHCDIGAFEYEFQNGADTVGVFRPSNGIIFLKNTHASGFADIALNYGIPGDYPVVGDWDGDGDDTIGVYRNGSFYLRNENTVGFADLVFPFGQPDDQPVAGDWNGDGIDTIGIFRPSTGLFMLRNDNSPGPADTHFFLGNVGDVGITGDWNGDGMDSTGVFRPSNGVIFLKNTNVSGFADVALNYGIPGDRPVVGDWDNDGDTTIGIYRNGRFFLRDENTVGFAHYVFNLGNPGDMPIAGNWDGSP